MLVSVIMPAFNRERFLSEAIESVLAQTFPDWELIVIDDGSTDETAAIANNFARLHPQRIRVLSQPNSGVVAARNAGIRESRGTHIAFLDSDDVWIPTKLERQIPKFLERQTLAFVYTGYVLMDESGRMLRTVRPDPRFQGDLHEMLWLEDNEILGATLLIEREALFNIGLFDSRLKGAENLDLRIKLAKLGRVTYVDDILYKYRRHAATLTGDQELMLLQHWKLIQAHFDSSGEIGSSLTLHRKVLSRYGQRCGDVAFIRGELLNALKIYFKALLNDPKLSLVIRISRCFLGKRGNLFLRRLKHGSVEHGVSP